MIASRIRILGVVLAAIGIAFIGGGIYAYTQVSAGYDSLQSFSEAQNVTLTYNEDGQLVDRGETAGAEAILDLLTEEWGYPVVESDLDPNDPLVNTATEYMYQMATVGYHVLHGTQTVVLEEDVEYNGEVFEAGSYDFAVDGRYWTDFDRSHPIEGPAREMAWTGTAHGLFGELGVGTVTASTLQLGLGVAGLLAGLGLTFIATGAGLIWAAAKKDDSVSRESESSPQELATV
ncbi:hypothetical protein [Euzebya sp.]|uniref:hypothetical protein n=1 Tax=Euzebya sp. TaxID=1971409 RepID=UPI00351333B4